MALPKGVRINYQLQADGTYTIDINFRHMSTLLARNVKLEELDEYLKVTITEKEPIMGTNILGVVFPTSTKTYYFKNDTKETFIKHDEAIVLDNAGKEVAVRVIEVNATPKKKPTKAIIRKHVPIEIPYHLEEPCEVRQTGVNRAITFNVLDEETMRKIGFTDHRDGYWYFHKIIGSGISFSVSFPKNGDQEELRIDVLDEMILQPYDYQNMLKRIRDDKFSCHIQREVEKKMAYLQEHGVLAGHKVGHYI